MAAKKKQKRISYPEPDKKPKSTNGLEPHWSRREGRWVWTFRQVYDHPVTKESKTTRVTAPFEYKGDTGKKAALKIKADFAKARHTDGWVPPNIEVKATRKARTDTKALVFYAKREADGTIIFKGILKEMDEDTDRGIPAVKDAQPKRTAFVRLGKFFNGKRIDEITPEDQRAFYVARVTATGVFKYKPEPGENEKRRKAGLEPKDGKCLPRMPEYEWSHMQSLINYALKLGFAVTRIPTIDLSKEPMNSPLYVAPGAGHTKVYPEPDQLQEIFDAGLFGDTVIKDRHRALWRTVYETAARPQAACKIQRGDVKFLDDGRAEITLRSVKNRQSFRVLPVSAVLAKQLRALIRPEERPAASEKAEREAWDARYVFETKKRDGSLTHWTEATYRIAWTAVLAEVGDGIEGMWMRDLRALAESVIANSGISDKVTSRFCGRRVPGSSDRYMWTKRFVPCNDALLKYLVEGKATRAQRLGAYARELGFDDERIAEIEAVASDDQDERSAALAEVSRRNMRVVS